MMNALIQWIPIEGDPKQKRDCSIKIPFSNHKANHRNEILKTCAIRLESSIEPPIPDNYVSPFNPKICAYCLMPSKSGKFDEFRPISQRGRMNIVNCVPCCGKCNSSKQAKCGTILITWINKNAKIAPEQKKLILEWFQENEKYMIIPKDTIDSKTGETYEKKEQELDGKLNLLYQEFS